MNPATFHDHVTVGRGVLELGQSGLKVRAKGPTVAEFWKTVREAIADDRKTVRLIAVLVVIGVIGLMAGKVPW